MAPWTTVQPATMIGFNQIEFFDHTEDNTAKITFVSLAADLKSGLSDYEERAAKALAVVGASATVKFRCNAILELHSEFG